jgi:hypothetical protein
VLKKIIKLINSQKTDIKQALKRRMHSDLLPENPLHDDFYLVSFPKSGVTWLMYLMANVNLKMSGIHDRRVTFFNLENLIPDINAATQIKQTLLPFPGCRVIKSHSPYNPFYNKIIYLVRDPRDVMVSYYHFSKNLNAFNGTMSEFIRSNEFGIDLWCQHVGSWFNDVIPSQYINFIRYEDLKVDAGSILSHIYTLLGYALPAEVVEYSVNNSSFANMKKDEEFYSRLNITLNPEFNFVRKGKAGTYKEELSDDDVRFITMRSEKWMKLFGYL